MRDKLLLGGGVVAIAWGLRFLGRLLGRKDYGGLDSIVSFSSRMIAATRALESQEESPLVKDPLAKVLAGPKAMARAQGRVKAAPEGSGRARQVGMMALRTKWFDDQLEASLGMPVDARGEEGSYVARTAPEGAAPRQVVMLGAGMDTRAWRLKLPAGLKWFEIDRADVLAAKQNELLAAGAEVPAPPTPMRKVESQNTFMKGQIGSLDHHLSGTFYPLRAASWEGVAADLEGPTWAADLVAAGFDPQQPTVWVAEGLLMYLEPPSVAALLRKAAGLSAPGSAFLAISVSEEVISDIQSKKVGRGSELMGTWKFGTPADPTQFLASNGWRADLVTDRARIAAALDLDAALLAFELEKATRSQFIAASVLPQQ